VKLYFRFISIFRTFFLVRQHASMCICPVIVCKVYKVSSHLVNGVFFPHSYILSPSKNIKKFKSLPFNVLQTHSLSTSIILSDVSLQELQELTLTHTSTQRDTYSRLDARSLNNAYRLLICMYSHTLTLSASSIIPLFFFIPFFLPPTYFGR